MAALYPHVPEAQITSPPNIRIRAVKLAFCVPAANLSSGLAKHTRCPNKQSCARAPALSQISPCGRRQPFLARKTHTMPAQTIPAHATRCRKLFHASADNPSARAKKTAAHLAKRRLLHAFVRRNPKENPKRLPPRQEQSPNKPPDNLFGGLCLGQARYAGNLFDGATFAEQINALKTFEHAAFL